MGELDSAASAWIGALERRARRKLRTEEAAAVAYLPIRKRRLAAEAHFAREGDPPSPCAYILAGSLFQTKLTRGGARQIVGLRMRNEFVGVQNLLLGATDHDVQALGPCLLLEVDAGPVRSAIAAHPGLAAILMADVSISCAIAQDWIVNVGRRDARSRVAHLLCELALRTDGGALARGAQYLLPLTQQQLADAVGLGRVAVNRVMRDLALDAIVSCEKSLITILDPARLEELGDFTARYLHLGQTERERRKARREPHAPPPTAQAIAAPEPAEHADFQVSGML